MPNIPGLIVSRVAGTAITKRRLVKYTATKNQVAQGAAAGDAICGVSTDIDSALGATVDVIRSGTPAVEYGGNVSAGDPLTSDAQGRAVVAASGRYAGFAEVAGVAGDIGAIDIRPGFKPA